MHGFETHLIEKKKRKKITDGLDPAGSRGGRDRQSRVVGQKEVDDVG